MATLPRSFAQRRFRFGARAVFLRLRTSNGFGRGAPLICSGDPPGDCAKMLFELFKAHRCQLLALGRLRHRPAPFRVTRPAATTNIPIAASATAQSRTMIRRSLFMVARLDRRKSSVASRLLLLAEFLEPYLLSGTDSFGASEATIFSKRGSPRSGSQKGMSLSTP